MKDFRKMGDEPKNEDNLKNEHNFKTAVILCE